jgi:hypothetical protein
MSLRYPRAFARRRAESLPEERASLPSARLFLRYARFAIDDDRNRRSVVIREHREDRPCTSRLASCSLNRKVHANPLG